MISRESQYLVGFVLRRDLLLAFENARSRLESLPGNSLCVFTQHIPVVGSGPPPLKLRKIVDLAPITITDQVENNIFISFFTPSFEFSLDPHGDGCWYVPQAGSQTDFSYPQWEITRNYHQEGCFEVCTLIVHLEKCCLVVFFVIKIQTPDT